MNRLILPYAELDAKRKQPFTDEMELAAITSLAEAKRKRKSSILGGEPEKLRSISKLYYPLWLVPWENEYVTVDGMNLSSLEATYEKLPDLASFVAKVEKTEKSYEQLMKVMEQNLKTFGDFVAFEKVSIEGVIAEKELKPAILEYFKEEIATKETNVDKSAFLEEKMNMKTAVAKVDSLADLWKKNQSDIEALQKTVSLLDSAAESIQKTLEENIADVKENYGRQTDVIRPVIEERVNQLTVERDETTKTITITMDKELETRNADKSEYEKELERLRRERGDFWDKKEAAKLRKDKVYVERWKLRVKEIDRQISGLEKVIKKLQRHMDDTKKEKEKTLKQIDERYQALIRTETDKVPSLEMTRDKEIDMIQEKIEQARAQTNAIIKQIQRLIEEKRYSTTTLKEVAVSWKLEDIVLICVPFYMAYYSAGAKQRHEFFAPVTVSSPEDILKRIRKKLFGFRLESRISLLLSQKSKALERMFSATFAGRIEEDYELKNRLREKCEQNDVLALADFREALARGTEALVEEGWMKSEEKDIILQTYAK